METTVLRKKLQFDIEKADYTLLKKINVLISDFEYQQEQDRLMKESEDDIKEGRVHTQNQMDILIKSWKHE